MIAKGSDSLKAYVGSTAVDKMYLGDTLVYSAVPEEPDVTDGYLTFKALESGTFTLSIPEGITTENLSYVEYSIDGGSTWVRTNNADDTAVTITTPTISAKKKVLWRGSGSKYCNAGAYNGATVYSNFTSTGNFEVFGHIMSLTLLGNWDSVGTALASYIFAGLFRGCTKLIYANRLLLPGVLGDYCYLDMFRGCSNLVEIPELPATVMETACYSRMFYGDSNLTYTPNLPSTSLANYCYNEMFASCTNITSAVLPATSGKTYGYRRMFYNASKFAKLRMMFVSIAANSVTDYMSGVASSGLFCKNINATWTTTGKSGVPTGWTIIYYDSSTDKYYLSDKTTECDEDGNVV